nr:hypothetical protein [Nitrospira sp.]
PSIAPSLLTDHPVGQAEPTALISEIVIVEEEIALASEPQRSPWSVQSHASMPEVTGCNAGAPQSIESVVPVKEVRNEPALPMSEGMQAQSICEPVVTCSDETNLASIESVQIVEVVVSAKGLEMSVKPAASREDTVPGAPAASEPSTDGSLRILWDDSSPKPTLSTGNILTRWLNRPKDVSLPEASHPATIPDKPLPPVTPPVGERAEATLLMTDRPVGRSDDSTPLPVEPQVPRPKPNKPAAGLAWRHIGRVASSLIGAGVSSTRSLIVLIVALVGFTLAILAGSVGALAVTWLILEEQPTSAYRAMTAVPQRTLQDSQKNGYFLLLGFGAPPTQDPVQAGIDRRVEEADRAVTHTCLTGEGTQQSASAEVAGKWLKTVDPAAQMRMETAMVKSWASQAGVAMGRYRQWLTKPFEDWGYGQPVSPNCGVILHTHRLYVAEGFAQDVEGGVARLETDLTAWRTVLGQAKTLPVKMLATDALNDDIAVVSGLFLRPDLDDRLISRLAKLARPLDLVEQSVRWPMQSQFVLATKTLQEAVNHDPADARPFYGSIVAALPLPKQRRFNAYAQYYEAVGKGAAEGRYSDLPNLSQFVRRPPYGLGDVMVNPIESLVGIDPLPTWETYAGRVLETDARLRLASLQAWLRRAPPEQDLLTRVAKAGQGLYDPFTGYPMLVNLKKGVFYSVGRDLKDNEAEDRSDIVAQIPPTAWAGGKRTIEVNSSK